MSTRDPHHYDSLDDYNADVIAARDAYRADREVEKGLCENGDGRYLAPGVRTCLACRGPEAP